MKYTRGELVRFGIVGLTGFLVNASVLTVLHQLLGWGLIISQLIAAETAIAINFTLHHTWTYSRYSQQSLVRRFLTFNLSMATASLITLATLVLLVEVFDLYYLTALVLAAGTGMVWNLAMNKLFIWRWIGDPEHIKAARKVLPD